VNSSFWSVFSLAIALGVSAPTPPLAKKRPREVLVLAAAAQESNEPAFVLLCTGADGKLRAGPSCRAPAPGTRARRPQEGEHTVGRPLLALPCELSRKKQPALLLDPPAPRGPFLAVWPSADAIALTPADTLATRVPDPPTLIALEAAVAGTPIIDQSLVLDLDHDGKDERLVSVRRKEGPAQLVLLTGEQALAWRALPTATGARAVRLLAVSDLDKNRRLELYVFSQLEEGWELRVIEAGADAPLSTLACGPPK
jgi:hypothetical protein